MEMVEPSSHMIWNHISLFVYGNQGDNLWLLAMDGPHEVWLLLFVVAADVADVYWKSTRSWPSIIDYLLYLAGIIFSMTIKNQVENKTMTIC